MKWSVAGLLLREVDNDLVQDQVVFATPTHQLLHLLPVSQVVVIPDETHHCSVFRRLHSVVGGSPWDTVVSHQNKQKGAETGGILTELHLV